MCSYSRFAPSCSTPFFFVESMWLEFFDRAAKILSSFFFWLARILFFFICTCCFFQHFPFSWSGIMILSVSTVALFSSFWESTTRLLPAHWVNSLLSLFFFMFFVSFLIFGFLSCTVPNFSPFTHLFLPSSLERVEHVWLSEPSLSRNICFCFTILPPPQFFHNIAYTPPWRKRSTMSPPWDFGKSPPPFFLPCFHVQQLDLTLFEETFFPSCPHGLCSIDPSIFRWTMCFFPEYAFPLFFCCLRHRFPPELGLLSRQVHGVVTKWVVFAFRSMSGVSFSQPYFETPSVHPSRSSGWLILRFSLPIRSDVCFFHFSIPPPLPPPLLAPSCWNFFVRFTFILPARLVTDLVPYLTSVFSSLYCFFLWVPIFFPPRQGTSVPFHIFQIEFPFPGIQYLFRNHPLFFFFCAFTTTLQFFFQPFYVLLPRDPGFFFQPIIPSLTPPPFEVFFHSESSPWRYVFFSPFPELQDQIFL